MFTLKGLMQPTVKKKSPFEKNKEEVEAKKKVIGYIMIFIC